MDIVNELNYLRNFKKEVEESCEFNAVIQNMNNELDIVRDNLTNDINRYKELSLSYENHINHIYNSICNTIIFKIEKNFEDFGMTEFNILDTINEFVDAYDICQIIIVKLKHIFIKHNKNNNNDFYYYHLQSNPYEWIIIFDTYDINENYMNLVCPEEEVNFIDCKCKMCCDLKDENYSEDDVDY